MFEIYMFVVAIIAGFIALKNLLQGEDISLNFIVLLVATLTLYLSFK